MTPKPWEPGEGPQRYIRELEVEVERLKIEFAQAATQPRPIENELRAEIKILQQRFKILQQRLEAAACHIEAADREVKQTEK